MKRIVIVISHLGYGHFTREIGLTQELLKLGLQIDLVTDEEKIINFQPKIHHSNFRYEFSPLLPTFTFDDQNRLDKESTKHSFQLMLDFDTQIREDREWERILQGADLLVNDIESFHNPIPKKLKIPIINISNFTWSDLLYHAELNEIGDKIADLESFSEHNIKLPFSTPCRSFGKNTTTMGLMLRTLDKQVGKTKSMLIKQFPYGRNFAIQELIDQVLLRGWFVYVSQEVFRQIHLEQLHNTRNLGRISNTGEYLQRLAESQIYIGKTGYSTLAECAHYGTRLLFWIRDGLLEDITLRDSVYQNNMGELMDVDLQTVLEQVERLADQSFTTIPNETLTIANKILEFIT